MKDKVTEIQIIPIKPKDGLVGFASLVFDHSFYFASIGIYTRPQGGYRLTYPTRRSETNNIPIFHPITKNIASIIEQAVIEKLEQVLGNE